VQLNKSLPDRIGERSFSVVQWKELK